MIQEITAGSDGETSARSPMNILALTLSRTRFEMTTTSGRKKMAGNTNKFIFGSVLAGLALYLSFAAMCRFTNSLLVQNELVLWEIVIMVVGFFVLKYCDEKFLTT